MEDTCVRASEGGQAPDVRVGELVGEVADQKERQSEYAEPVWNELQEAAAKT